MFKSKEKIVYELVEVKEPKPVLDPEAKASAASLAGHPGFKYLLATLALEKSKLETTLKYARHDSLKDVEFLQAGIHWCGFVEKKLQSLGNEVRAEVRQKASLDEQEVFERLHQSLIEPIGS